MSFVPLSRSQLEFIADEFWPGGGENGDGRDLFGVAEHHEAWRQETTDADLIAEALHPDDADYLERVGEEAFDRELDEMETEADDAISVDGQPLDAFLADNGDSFEFGGRRRDEYDDLPDGEDGPDSLELAITREVAIDPWCVVVPRRWNEDDLVRVGSESDRITPAGPGVAAALERFERDGVRKVSLSASRAREFRTHDRRRDSWPNIGGWKRFDPVMNLWVRENTRWNGRRRYDSWKRHREAQYRARRITDAAYRDAA